MLAIMYGREWPIIHLHNGIYCMCSIVMKAGTNQRSDMSRQLDNDVETGTIQPEGLAKSMSVQRV